MTNPKFVDELPELRQGRGAGRKTPHLDKLRANPGQWAEVARYPRESRVNATSRGLYTRRKHPDIEYTTRTIGDEVFLYMRAVSA